MNATQNTLAEHLNWLLNTEPLVTRLGGWRAWRDHPDYHVVSALLSEDQNSAPAESYPRRLGLYCEKLIQDHLRGVAGSEKLLHNVALRTAANQTVGELDILYQTRQENWLHVELATKFYLKVDSNPVLSAYIGPNTNDSLAAKLGRLDKHQLPLANHALMQPVRYANNIQDIESVLHMTGRLFYPLHANLSPAPELNPNHLRGVWAKIEQLDEIFTLCRDWKIITNKHDWLVANSDDYARAHAATESEVKHRLNEKELVVIYSRTGVELPGLGLTNYGFVASNNWLERAKSAACRTDYMH